jgi:hypothetical protein
MEKRNTCTILVGKPLENILEDRKGNGRITLELLRETIGEDGSRARAMTDFFIVDIELSNFVFTKLVDILYGSRANVTVCTR